MCFCFCGTQGFDKSCPVTYDVVYIRATSWENLFMPYANNKSADQPAHPRSLISAFAVRCLDSIIPLVSISKISSLYLASVAVQAALSLPWSQPRRQIFSWRGSIPVTMTYNLSANDTIRVPLVNRRVALYPDTVIAQRTWNYEFYDR